MKHLDGTLHYKGYAAKVSYDKEDDWLYADCMVVGDMLVATGENLSELKESFQRVVDDYERSNNDSGKTTPV